MFLKGEEEGEGDKQGERVRVLLLQAAAAPTNEDLMGFIGSTRG
jgi:hypothetical protein